MDTDDLSDDDLIRMGRAHNIRVAGLAQESARWTSNEPTPTLTIITPADARTPAERQAWNAAIERLEREGRITDETSDAEIKRILDAEVDGVSERPERISGFADPKCRAGLAEGTSQMGKVVRRQYHARRTIGGRLQDWAAGNAAVPRRPD